MITVKDIVDFVNTLAPFDTKAEWDNCGLLVGDASQTVKKVGFCLDLTAQTLREARENGVDLIVTHHPVIFKAQKSFLSGSLVFELAKSGISAVCAHTCYDMAQGGVNDVLAEILGLRDVEPLSDGECVKPLLRIGNIEETDGESFAKYVAKKLHATVGLCDSGKKISKVAVCSGAGGDLWECAYQADADAFVTGEARHNEMLDAVKAGITMITAGHFETENPAMPALMKRVAQQFPNIETLILKQDSPVKYTD